MKHFLLYIIIIFNFIGCDITQPETHHLNLDGEYRVETLRASFVNKISGQKIDTTFTSGIFATFSAIEPLDVIEIGTEKMKFSGNKLLMDSDTVEWGNSFYYEKVRDVVTQKESIITIFYFDTRRVFTVVDISDNYLILRSSGQWQGASPEGVFLTYTMVMNRIND